MANASDRDTDLDPAMKTIMLGDQPEAPRPIRSEAGFSIVETVIATSILLVVLVGLMSAMGMAAALTENEGHLSARAAEYAQDKMEQLLALSYSDIASDTTQIPTASANGAGLAAGGSQDPAAPAEKYVDYLDPDGKPLCPCTGTTVPANWFYKRVWLISTPAGSTNLKQITVTAVVVRSVANKIIPRATVTALRTRIGNE
jgi:type II secretory pathway pseudopilin PulG